ncbi:MAG: hypothetical protein OEZ39_05480 [Gammaproteobacteria bacterium]|nr:hypothetical protein [Gammaproteobacteria bacterium]MDH5651306.1 hypothetical protein [Gammaproteobacteria bacterium]
MEEVWGDKAWERKYSALIIIMSVTVVETFMNVFFKMLVESEEYIIHREWVNADINKRVCIEEKLRKWPIAVFGQCIQFDQGAGQQFQAIKMIRNFLVHFTSKHETVGVLDGFIEGMADTTEYDALKKEDAILAVRSTEGMIEEVLKVSGVNEVQLVGAIHYWTGKPG